MSYNYQFHQYQTIQEANFLRISNKFKEVYGDVTD